jgi:hypothetical protein
VAWWGQMPGSKGGLYNIYLDHRIIYTVFGPLYISIVVYIYIYYEKGTMNIVG